MTNCKQKEHHGMSRTRIWRIYHAIRGRCYNPNNARFKCYGGRGIKMCAEWLESFAIFHKFAVENGYNDKLTTERVNVNGNYEPANVTFIPCNEQLQNTRRTKHITIGGETKTLREWSVHTGLSRECIRSRMRKGASGRELIKDLKKHKFPDARRLSVDNNIPLHIIYSRLQRGCTGKQLIAPYKPIGELITINGISKTRTEWSKYLGISINAFCARVASGKTGIELLKKPRMNRKRLEFLRRVQNDGK